MADTTSTSGDRTVVVHRHSALTYISLGFNALILLLILIGIVCGHHKKRHEHGGWGGGHHEWADRDGGGHHHHFGPMRGEWGHRDFGNRDGGQCSFGKGPGGWNRPGSEGENHQGPDMSDHHGWDDGGKPGFGGPSDGHPGFGGFGGMDHKPMTPPSSEEMTDHFMLALTQKLSLTDAENTQIRPIIQQGIAQFQKDMEAQKQAHQKMIDDAKAKIRATLTPDQQKQFDQMTAGFGAHAPPAPPAK